MRSCLKRDCRATQFVDAMEAKVKERWVREAKGDDPLLNCAEAIWAMEEDAGNIAEVLWPMGQERYAIRYGPEAKAKLKWDAVLKREAWKSLQWTITAAEEDYRRRGLVGRQRWPPHGHAAED